VTERPYQFRGEWIADILDRVMGRTIDDEDVEVAVREGMELPEPDECGQLLLVERSELQSVADHIAANIREDILREKKRRMDILFELSKHADCDTLLGDLLAERDDLIAGVQDARSYCFNDITLSEYGDRYVIAEPVLDQLRPRKSASTPGRSLDDFEGVCEGCGGAWVHDDGCPVEEYAISLKKRAKHEQRSHRHCTEIAQELFAQIDAEREHVETIADLVRSQAHTLDGEGLVINPHDVLHLLAGPQPCQEIAVNSHSATFYPRLEAIPYCDSDEMDHSAPHRACRYLVS
jgi:hypothetical protein